LGLIPATGMAANGPQVKFGGDRRRVSMSPAKNQH